MVTSSKSSRIRLSFKIVFKINHWIKTPIFLVKICAISEGYMAAHLTRVEGKRVKFIPYIIQGAASNGKLGGPDGKKVIDLNGKVN